MHFQNLTICGRVVSTPEKTEKLVKVRVVCNDKEPALFITCCAYGDTAEALLRSCDKGDPITVVGNLRLAQRGDNSIYWVDVGRFHAERKASARQSASA